VLEEGRVDLLVGHALDYLRGLRHKKAWLLHSDTCWEAPLGLLLAREREETEWLLMSEGGLPWITTNIVESVYHVVPCSGAFFKE